MSKAEHWFPLYVGDYLADTGHLSASEHGAYLLLLMHQWRNGCIPDDERQLTKITRTTAREWRAISATVLAFFDCGENGFQQGRLERVRAEQAEKRQRLSEAGRKAGKASAAQRSFNDRSTVVNQGLVEPSCNQPEPETEIPSSLRSEGPADAIASPAVTPPPDARTALWTEGLARLRRLTGKPDRAARALLGQLCRAAADDCALVSGLLHEAEAGRVGDPVPWLQAAIRTRTGARAPAKPQTALGQWAAILNPEPPAFDFEGQAEELMN